MSNFISFTVSELYILTRGRSSPSNIMHKGKVKTLVSITPGLLGMYTVRIKLVASRNYTLSGDTVLKMDLDHSIVDRNRFWNALGTSRKFRLKDWLPGHWGVFISREEVYDSVRGRRAAHELPDNIRIFDEAHDTARTQAVADIKQRFVEDPALNMTCGFELETQSTNSVSRRDIRRLGRIKAAELIMNTGPAKIPAWMREDLPFEYSTPQFQSAACQDNLTWKRWLDENNIETYQDLVSGGFITEDGLFKIRAWIIDDLDEDEEDEDMFRESVTDEWGLSSDIDIAFDDSVSGFELRTNGPRTVLEFESALKEVFTLNHEITTRCSFHIHIKVNGLKHTFNRAQRQHLIRYLFQNIDRLPTTVRERWADHEANYFFMPDDGLNKMNFINFHNRLGTLEFRCFGNVRTVEDGIKCLELAVEALQDFYSNESPVFIDDNMWGPTARQVMEHDSVEQLDRFVKMSLDHINAAREDQATMLKILPELHKIHTNRQFNFTVGD